MIKFNAKAQISITYLIVMIVIIIVFSTFINFANKTSASSAQIFKSSTDKILYQYNKLNNSALYKTVDIFVLTNPVFITPADAFSELHYNG